MIRILRWFSLLLALFAAGPLAAQSNIPRGSEVVAPAAYVSLEPVPRGRAFELAVVLKIRPGFHINAREVSADYLIPTDLSAQLPDGFRAGALTYPSGVLRPFKFSPGTKLNVYEDKATLRMKLEALSNAPLGPQKIALKLRYQACSDEICLPPTTLPVEAHLRVAAPGAPAHAAHPEIFFTVESKKTGKSR